MWYEQRCICKSKRAKYRSYAAELTEEVAMQITDRHLDHARHAKCYGVHPTRHVRTTPFDVFDDEGIFVRQQYYDFKARDFSKSRSRSRSRSPHGPAAAATASSSSAAPTMQQIKQQLDRIENETKQQLDRIENETKRQLDSMDLKIDFLCTFTGGNAARASR